jgi:hypothetical protein
MQLLEKYKENFDVPNEGMCQFQVVASHPRTQGQVAVHRV